MLSFFEDRIDSDTSYKKCFLLIIICKKFCKNNNIGIGNSSLFDHISGDIKLCSMTVIQSEPVKHTGHLLDIIFHILPCIWRFAWLFPIPNSNKISPYIYSSPEVVELFRKCKVLSTISTSNPAVIQGPETLLWPFCVFTIFWNSGKIFRH